MGCWMIRLSTGETAWITDGTAGRMSEMEEVLADVLRDVLGDWHDFLGPLEP